MSEIETFKPFCAEALNKLSERLEKALVILVENYTVRKNEFSISINGPLSAYVEVIVLSRAWSKPLAPCKSSHLSDHHIHAGNYILSGIDVVSTISLPAISCSVSKAQEDLAKATSLSTIMLSAESYLQNELKNQVCKIGEVYLKKT